MAGWNEAPTVDDLQEWLQDLDDQDWDDLGTVAEYTVTRRKVAHRDSRTPLEHFDHLHKSGMTASAAKRLTEAWLAAGGDATEYTVTTKEAQQRPNEIDDRPKFAGFYRGPPRLAEAASCGKKVKHPEPETTSKRLGQIWFEMRRNG
jgi:hypothetical protein